jgi:hypothetical protein
MSDPDIDLFRALEQALHRPEVRGSRQAVAALLADNFVEFGSSGRIYDKAIVVDALAKEASAANTAAPEMLDFTVQALAPDVVLVTYRSCTSGENEDRNVLRSSIWKQVGGSWQMLFHQGTTVPKLP